MKYSPVVSTVSIVVVIIVMFIHVYLHIYSHFLEKLSSYQVYNKNVCFAIE